MKPARPFLILWTLAVIASVAAFVLHLGLRSRTFQLGYEMGKLRNEQARLRETKRVLEIEVAALENPQRVEVIAKTLLHMQPPTPERIISLRDVRVPRKRPEKASSLHGAQAKR